MDGYSIITESDLLEEIFQRFEFEAEMEMFELIYGKKEENNEDE